MICKESKARVLSQLNFDIISSEVHLIVQPGTKATHRLGRGKVPSPSTGDPPQAEGWG